MITRENYEEYFLLYTDNELSAAERMEVERFIADHPDLREEWETLLQCRITPETDLVFPGRNALLKPETEGSVYTEDLLLYLDKELDPHNIARIETIIGQQPRVARELAALRQAVIHPDLAIAYPYKAELIRDEKSRRIIALPWVRAGIAASVAGAVALLLLLSAPPRKQLVATQGKRSVPAVAAAPSVTTIANTHDRNIAAAVTPGATHPLHNRTGQERVKKTDLRDLAVTERKGATPATRAATVDSGPAGPETTIGHAVPAGADPAGMVAISSVSAPSDLAVIVRPAVQIGIPKDQSSFATQALQEEANDERLDNFISDEPTAPGKAKLRGLFRKVTRAFGKTADRDSEGNRQVLVGAFQVSLN
jgi:hypothetical protein